MEELISKASFQSFRSFLHRTHKHKNDETGSEQGSI